MSWGEAMAWLNDRINLERRPDAAAWTSIKLERVERLCELLGRPQDHGRVIHLAGSKGKGSTAAMVESVLRAAGWRTGLYTSPDLLSRRERCRVNGQSIGEEELARLVLGRVRPAAEAYAAEGHSDELSFFDLFTAIGFCWFQERNVDWSVIEVGLGGRLDATNVVHPVVAGITTLCLEHTQFLGETLAEIAAEKAGIIKPGVPVVTTAQVPEAQAVLARVALERGAELVPAGGVTAIPGGEFVELPDGRVGQRLRITWPGSEPRPVLLPLLGGHQLLNAAVARTLLATAVPQLAPETVVDGLEAVVWPGRLQVLDRRPWLVLDGAHTPDAAARLVAALALFPHRRRYLVVGAARDKNVAGLLAGLAPGSSGIVVTGIPDNPRAAAASELAPPAQAVCAHVVATATPAEAVAQALAWAGPDDLVCVTGSLYLVGAVLADREGASSPT